MASTMKPRAAAALSLRDVLAGLVLPPLAWIAQTVIAETLAAQACYPFDRPLSAPIVPWMRVVLIVISALCFVVGGLGGWIAWRNLRHWGAAMSERSGAADDLRHPTAELAGFLSRIAAMCSALFLFALIATDIALAIVSPCRWW
nr:hypothetical protein HUO10_005353 [Paraburkholderia busanensis]